MIIDVDEHVYHWSGPFPMFSRVIPRYFTVLDCISIFAWRETYEELNWGEIESWKIKMDGVVQKIKLSFILDMATSDHSGTRHISRRD